MIFGGALLTVLGSGAVALLIFALTVFDGRITSIEDRISRLEERVDAGFAEVDAKFAAQDTKIDEINLKLTALIAALNKTEEIEAALDGELLDSEAADAESRTSQPTAS